MTMQVADASKVLVSTGKTCDAINIQIFTRRGGWIISEESAKDIMKHVDETQNKLEMKRENGTYVYDAHVKKAQECRRHQGSRQQHSGRKTQTANRREVADIQDRRRVADRYQKGQCQHRHG